jgi:hypothetical protein
MSGFRLPVICSGLAKSSCPMGCSFLNNLLSAPDTALSFGLLKTSAFNRSHWPVNCTNLQTKLSGPIAEWTGATCCLSYGLQSANCANLLASP